MPALLVLLGCEPGGPGSGDGASAFRQYDSAGVLVSVTDGGAASSPIGWDVDTLPDLKIGSGDSPSDYLYRVQGVRGLPGGGVLVVDGGSQELRYFDSTGTLVRRAGGRGEGPGEFQDPVLVPGLETDSLLLFDKRLPRLQTLDREGGYRNSVRYEKRWPSGRLPPVGAGGGRLLFRGGRPGVNQTVPPSVGLTLNERTFFWYDLASGDTVGLGSYLFESFTTRRVTSSVPFRAIPVAAVWGERAVLITGRASEILEYDTEGRLRRILRVDEPRRPVTREMIERMAEVDASTIPPASPASRKSFWLEEYAQMPVPDSLPAFQTLAVDEMGWLWVERYEFDPLMPKEWMVFDQEGRVRGTVRTPAGLRIEWIGKDAILGVWLDEMDVEQVRRHRLTR